MNLLLDTHVLLLLIGDQSHLKSQTLEAIFAPFSIVAFSMATVWEAEIKQAKGALTLPDQIWAKLEVLGYAQLSITRRHCEAAARLPHHHRDPFDRMLVAQALTEGMTLVTADTTLSAYGVPILW